MLSPGSRLGPYEVVALAGAGGMGEVYKARDTHLDRTVAIKILPPAFAADPQFRERFDREARTISQLTHPHICRLYDVGHQSGADFDDVTAAGQRFLMIKDSSVGRARSTPAIMVVLNWTEELKTRVR